MVFAIFIAFLSLIGLIILHEFGHFILAKKFKVKVEEFGIGYPPRIFGKKIGETLYSLNLLPFGAFVKIYGEEKRVPDRQSFSARPIWQRSLIVLGGVVSFWLIASILLSVVFLLGAPTLVEDQENQTLIDPKVQVVMVAPGSPAQISGIKPGDTILEIGFETSKIKVDKVKKVQEFVDQHRGKEIILTLQRGKEIFDLSLIPRISPPKEEGPMGVALVRTAIKSFPWHQALIRGMLATGELTFLVIKGWAQALQRWISGLPTGVELMGPVGIFSLFVQAEALGINYFLQFIAIIAIYVALFNLLPVPALDGGKLLFLGIEKIRKKPVSQKLEQQITAFFFALLILLMILVTFRDIQRLF